ncbi:MAG TPA: organomercurial lyase [Candidatus Dormibacteraeota bacterium]|nr:organomercurial lyase [Candidatus Dormibacteraeota bacterium]
MTAADQVRNAAFRRLLSTASPVAVANLAEATGISSEEVSAVLEELHNAGRIRRDAGGRVIGSAGLNVTPDRHEIDLDGRRFWTWCAYDILGVFGALHASGRATSPSPDGSTIEVRFEGGRPVSNTAVLFRPDDELMECCANVYEEWCPNSNLFADAELARTWAGETGMTGRVMTLDEAADLGAADWADLVAEED